MNSQIPVRRSRSATRFVEPGSAKFSALNARVIRPVRDRLRLVRRLQDGLEAVEYALIAALISAVLVGIMTVFGPQLEGIFEAIGGALDDAAGQVENPGGDGGGGDG